MIGITMMPMKPVSFIIADYNEEFIIRDCTSSRPTRRPPFCFVHGSRIFTCFI